MRNSRHSLSKRLVLSISVMLAVVWVLGVGLAIHVMREEFDEVFDSALQETTERLAPLVVDDFFRREDPKGPQRVGDPPSGTKEEYLTYQVRDAAGRVLLHSHDVSSRPYAAPLIPGFWGDDDHRFFTVATVSGSLFVQVADSLEHRWEATLESALVLLIPLMLIMPFGMVATWWIVKRATRPIGTLRDAISERDGTNLAQIVMPDLPQELASIPLSINNLLGRLQATLQAERDLAANSAHELRTPLAGALAQTELLLAQLETKRDKARAEQVLTALRRLSLMLEKLLQLARAEAGIGAAGAFIDLSSLFELVLDEFKRASPALSIEVVREAPAGSLLRKIDPDAFAIAFKNVLENASRHGQQGRTIHIRLSKDGRVQVRNAAPHLLEQDVDIYRQRFKRGLSTGPGSGLGLAIVDKLMQQMKGALVLRSYQLKDGETVFEAELDFSGAGEFGSSTS